MSNFRRRAATLGGDDFESNYIKLDFIENPSNAYINTGFRPSNTTRVNAKLAGTQVTPWAAFFGCRGANAVPAYSLYYPTNDAFYAHISDSVNGSVVTSTPATGIHTIDYNNKVLHIDTQAYTINSSAFQVPVNLTLFVSNENGVLNNFTKSKIYYFTIWDNGVKIRDFRPAKRKRDGEIGLYDLVGKKFYLSPNGTKFSGMEYIPSGVYILNSQGQFITSDKWQGGTNNAVGIAVISSYYRYLTPVDWYEIPGCRWGTEGKVISGIVTSTDIYVADDDYYGVENTNKIIAQDSTSDAAKFCKDYKWPQCPYTLHGYLPAMGELIRLRDNFPSIRKCFEAMGLRIPFQIWSSTQSDSTRSWIVRFDTTDFDNYRPYPPYRGDKKINYQPLPISKI